MRLPLPQMYSLKSRVALAVALVFVVFAGLLVRLGLSVFETQYRHSLYQQQFALATALGSSIDEKLQSAQQMLVASATLLPAGLFDDMQRAQRFLDEQTVLKTVFDHSLMLVSAEGRVLADTPALQGRRGSHVGGRGFVQDTLAARQPQISQPFAAPHSAGRPVLMMTAPVLDSRGRLRGMLMGGLDLLGYNHLAELQNYRIGQSGYISLFTRERILISHRDPARIMQPAAQPGQNPLLDRAIDGFEGTGPTVTSRGVSLVASFKRLHTTPWILSVNLPQEEAEAPLRQARQYFFLVAAAGTLLVLVLVWRIMKASLSPLARLTEHLRELPQRSGHERQLRLRASGEIGTLIDSFNTMVANMAHQQQTLQESEARFRSLAEMSTDWYWEQDAEFRFTLMSQGLDQTGVASLKGRRRWELPIVNVSPEQWAEHRALLERHEPFRNFVYQVRAANGELRTFSISGAPIIDAQGVFRGYRGIGSDVTERLAARQRIEYLAYHDALTGLPNRLLAQDRFGQAMAQAERSGTRVALAYLDLDNFKTINDTLGHVAGDEFLKEVARRLRQSVRDSDTISRQGGDEFLLVLRDLPDTEVVSAVIMKIMDRLQDPYQLGTHEVSSSASIGVAIAPADGRDFETLRKKADLAMYRSKEAGRNAWHYFDPTMDADASEHLLLRNGLRRALERQEFRLHYQPQYELASGRLIGAEALIRWQHPELGLLPPGRFIAVAEESGLIVPMGDWVLREACRQLRQWEQAGLALPGVSVNLSAIQFRRGNLEASVRAALQASELAPARLELELTESILIQNVESVLASVQRLKQLGVQLAIDDFGTGYSSLSYLKRFAIDRLKIDRSFVRDLATDADDAAIVRAIIQMAHSLNLRTLAEGVETEDMRARLQSFGCDEVQGYLYGRPLPAEEFEQLLRARPDA